MTQTEIWVNNSGSHILTGESDSIPAGILFYLDRTNQRAYYGHKYSETVKFTPYFYDKLMNTVGVYRAYSHWTALEYIQFRGAWVIGATDYGGARLSNAYTFKLQRPARVYQGEKHIFTLPKSANVHVNGHSSTGAKHTDRVNIEGWTMSAHQAKETGIMAGTATTQYDTNHTWWIDCHANIVPRLFTQYSTLSGKALGDLSGL